MPTGARTVSTIPPQVVAKRTADDAGGAWAIGPLFAFALVVGAYFAFRFGGRWTESDTATMASSIRSIVTHATILHWDNALYPNGYAFGAVSAFVLAFTGVSIATLLQVLYPLVSASLVATAWPLYRELTGSARAATLATLILFLQPEFLFVVLRGSHERILRALLFISLWLLVRSFRYADRPTGYLPYVGLFHLSVFGILATNSFFGSSYIWALTVVLAGSWLGAYLGPGLKRVSELTKRRLIYVPLFCFVLAFVFNGYVYPPAGRTLSQVPDILEGLQRLLLTTSPDVAQQPVEFDPYAAVAGQWINIKIYFLLSTATYLLIVGSVVVWVRTGLRWLARATEQPTLGQWLLWLVYAAFALQSALSIIADRAGTFGGNLQHRSFPSFVMVAAPLVALELMRWRPTPRLRALAATGLGMLALFAIVKATNDPIVSNKWTFYVPAEFAAVGFAERHVPGRLYWREFDERLSTLRNLFVFRDGAIDDVAPPDTTVRTYLITDVTRQRSARLSRPLPPVTGELRVYDNGEAQIYRQRAHTPYQR